MKRVILTGGMGALDDAEGQPVYKKFVSAAPPWFETVTKIHLQNWELLKGLKKSEWIFAYVSFLQCSSLVFVTAALRR